MIRFILIQNKLGRTRMAKWYSEYTTEEKRLLESEIHRLVVNRATLSNSGKHTNFIEFRSYKLVYRRYAGLFFTVCCDPQDNELAMLEAIHLFVESMNEYFGNICELHLIFEFHRVHLICDEIFLAGEVQETGKEVINGQMTMLDKF